MFFTHFWPGSPLNQSPIQQIFMESLLYVEALGETSLQSILVAETDTIPHNEKELDGKQMTGEIHYYKEF